MKTEKPDNGRTAFAPVETDPEEKLPVPDDFETRPEFAPLIAAVSACEPERPPDGFTARVMERLTGERCRKAAGRRQRLAQRLRSLTETASSGEIAGCFLLAAFFYLVLGSVLLVGFHRLGPLAAGTGWMTLQPRLALVFAVGLAVMGLLIRNGGRWAVATAVAGLRLYILLAAANGLGLQLAPALPFGAWGGLFFTAGMILMGIFLAAAVNGYRRQLSVTAAGSAALPG